jgi:radical SAM protein with 4Fe4S-binding SPASM domain
MNTIAHLVSLARLLNGYRKKMTALPALPTRLWVEPTNVCNLKCTMCLNKKLSPAEKGYMDYGLFRKLIDEVKDYAFDIYLHHRGEPFLHPEFVAMVNYAKYAGLRVKVHTNATVLTETLSKGILHSKLDLLSFSIDGCSAEEYEKIRINATFDETIENIETFLKLKKAGQFRHPYTVIEQILFSAGDEPAEENDSARFARRFKELGLDELICKRPYNWAGDFETGESVLERFSRGVCTFPWYSTVVFWDGTVAACPQDFFGKINLGNVGEKPIGEIWNDRAYIDFRKKMIEDVAHLHPCAECDRLRRKRIGGIPFQYLLSFITDNLIGYGRLRKSIGSHERNQ